MATIQELMNSIAQMEGFNTPGTIAQRYNNPGNLRYAPTQNGSASTASGTFATFATPEDGWAALQSYIEGKAASGMDLRNFIYMYAPPTENNTSNYLNFVSGQLGASPDSSLADIFGGSGGSNILAGGGGSGGGGSLDFTSIGDAIAGVDPMVVGLVGIGVVGLLMQLKG